MNTQEIKVQFEEILEQVKDIRDMPEEYATRVATVILQESGKDRRTELLSASKLHSNGRFNNSSQPATFKQEAYMKRLGIKFADGITKSEASELIDKAIEQSDITD